MPGSGEITLLLRKVRKGDETAQAQLIDLVYPDLRRLAGTYMRKERPNHTLQATALLNEAWIELVHDSSVDWQDRVHFFALAARCMRRVLVEHARTHNAQKRGGGTTPVELLDHLAITEDQLDAVLIMHQGLDRLAELDARQASIVEMRFFGGLTEDEIAAVLDISTRTVKREWRMARDWLSSRIT